MTTTMERIHNDPAKTKSKSGRPTTTTTTKPNQPTKANANTAAGGATSKSSKAKALEIDMESDRWPYCIVWTPLPVVTWLVPIVGHTGIANSRGIIYDFSDDYSVSVDNFSFGAPTKYHQFSWQLVPNGPEAWDRAIRETADYYSRTRHSLFFNNCHQYIAGVLNKVKYSNRNDWTQVEVWWRITFCSTYTGFLGFIRQWWPFTVIIIAVIVFCCLAF